MIRFLGIRDLAIIDTLECEFEPGFNVLTGETGAGKSIIVGALGLLVGERGSASAVRDRRGARGGARQRSKRPGVTKRSYGGKCRPPDEGGVFIDDALSSTTTLRTLGAKLLDIHGQHAHQALLDPRTHLGMLDAFGGSGTAVDLIGTVRARHERWREARVQLAEAERNARGRAERIDALTFALAEIDRVAPQSGEEWAAPDRTAAAGERRADPRTRRRRLWRALRAG